LAPLTKRGVIDPQGNKVVNPTFAWIGSFSEGLAAAQPSEKNLYHWATLTETESSLSISRSMSTAHLPSMTARRGSASLSYLPNKASKSIEAGR
jgi:hypothetical protein